MKKRIFLYALFLALAVSAAQADVKDDVQKGDRAFQAKDYATALQSYQQAAKEGSAAAENNLGYLCEKGLGAPLDVAEALKHYQKAAEAGNATGQNNLGRLYAQGLGVGKDNREAFRWHAKAAAQGDPEGEYWVGYSYALGKGVKKNITKAAQWMNESAKAGYAPAQAGLGHLYQEGLGVKKDEAQSKEWYQRAAAQKDPATSRSLAKEKGEYEILPGDTLWSIARRLFAQGHLWKVIFEANKEKLSNPALIRPGRVLSIPANSLAPEKAS